MFDNEFYHKIDKIIDLLIGEIGKINPIVLICGFNVQSSFALEPDSKSNLPDGFVRKFHYIIGLVSSIPRASLQDEYGDPQSFDKIIELTEKLFDEYQYLWLTRPSLDGSLDKDKTREYTASLTAFLSSLLQPELGNTDQFKNYMIDYITPFDERFYVPVCGISANTCIVIVSEIMQIIATQFNKYKSETQNLFKPAIECFKQYKDGKITIEEVKKEGQKNEITYEQFKENQIRYLHMFKISKNQLYAVADEQIVDRFFREYSFKFGDINKSFKYPTDFNELDEKFILDLENSEYYIPECNRLIHSLSSALHHKILTSSLAPDFIRQRDKTTQSKTVQHLRKIFNHDQIIENAYYGCKDPREFECDIIIPSKRTLIICEIKSKEMREPLYTRGNIVKIKDDFKVTIQHAYNQAIRTRDYILSREKAFFVDQHKKPIIEIKRGDYDEYLLLVITAKCYGGVATDLSMLLEKKENDPYPLAISLMDLELFVTKINTPEMSIDYMRQRCKLHDFVFSHDELDYAGYYLKYRNLDFEDYRRKGVTKIYLRADYSKIFDDEFLKSHGIEINTSDEVDSPSCKFIKRNGDEIAIGIEGMPETYETFHFGKKTILGEKIKRMSGRERNSPCPCGSGKKYKHCCGK